MAPDAFGGATVTVSRLINRNVVAERGRTSMRLEPELWDALLEICDREGQDMSSLVRRIEQIGHSGGRTSAVRVFVMSYFRVAATEAGHGASGHGALTAARRSGAPHAVDRTPSRDAGHTTFSDGVALTSVVVMPG
jgi:predicted DNA-binding ribbon-helix-helix protein